MLCVEFFGVTQGSGLFHLGAFAQDGISPSASHLPTLTHGTPTLAKSHYLS